MAVDSAARFIFQALELAEILIQPGIQTIELAESLEKSLIGRGADTGIIISISPEDIAWHGIPGKRSLSSGEIVTVDIACSVRGWWADAARTYPVGDIDKKRKNLLCAAWKATNNLVSMIKVGERGIGTTAAVEMITHEYGVSLISEGAGHGIGRGLHFPPSLTYDGRTHEPMVDGFLYTAEPVFTSGKGEINISRNGSAVTIDGEPTAHFELTMLLIRNGTQILGSPEWISHPPC